MATFTTKDDVKMRKLPRPDGEVVVRVPKDQVVEEVAAPAGATSDTWRHVRYKQAGAIPFDGWLPNDMLVEGGDVALVPIDQERFVIYSHVVSGAFNMPQKNWTHPAIPDFLLALAAIISGTTNKRQGARVGPFGYEPAEWARLLASPAAPPGFFGALDAIENPYSQLAAASVEMHENGVAMTALHAQAGLSTVETPFVPDYLSLLHSRLLGTKAAFALWQAAQPGAAPGQDLVKLVAAAQGIGEDKALELLKARPDLYLAGGVAGGAPLNVTAFNSATEALLNSAFVAARTLLLKFVPELRPSGGAKWMEFAEELKDKVTEAANGDLIKEFFAATNYANPVDPNDVPPWCGAFVAHCLKKAGGAAAKSIMPGAALASTWKTWGDRALPWAGDAVIPRGAVVVLSPAETTDSSGHVGFFVSKTATHVKLLGGNQSNAVKTTDFAIGKIVAVRWLEEVATRYNEAAIPDGTKDMADLIVARFSAAGFSPRHQIAALANAIEESKLDPKARRQAAREDSVGLFQCNRKGGLGEPIKGQPYSVEQLEDPEFNLTVIITEAQKQSSFVKAATLEAAVEAFVRDIERPELPGPAIALRMERANKLREGL